MKLANTLEASSHRKLLIQRIAASRHFNRSARLRDLLLYVADRVLDDGVTEIHEQEVGHEVFGRPANYDTTSDNIVRVHASMLRKRLEQYFEEAGAEEPIVIEIPKGNYAPVFRPRTTATLVEARPDVPAKPRRVNGLTWTLAAVAVLFAASTAYLMWRPAAPVSGRTEAPQIVRLFWSQLFRPGTPTDIVVDDSSIGIYQDMTGRAVKLAEYFDRDYLRSVGREEENLPQIVIRRQTSYADTSFLFKLLQSPADLSRGVLHFARDYSFRELKANDVILLGNSRTNPWVEPFESKLGIRWTYDGKAGTYRPVDTFAGGRQFGGEPGARDSYCAIALLPNLGGNGSVLLISGTGGSAFTAAADFLVDDQSLTALRRMLPASNRNPQPFPPFEALIQVNGRSASARDKSIVFARTARGS